MLSIDGATEPRPELLTVNDQVTTLQGLPPATRATPEVAPAPGTAMAIWTPQAVVGRWEMRIRVLPGADPAAVVGMELLPAGGLGERIPGLGEGPHLDSRIVAQFSATDSASAWRHWAVERTTSSTRLFLDGRLLQESRSPHPRLRHLRVRGCRYSCGCGSSPPPDVGTVPARAELEWVAFYPADGS